MKEIQLTRGKVALVDDEDFEWLNKFNWIAAKRKFTYYANRSVRKGGCRVIAMHRLILGIEDSKIHGEHRDGDGLNNQRYNLRQATSAQNQANRGSFGKSIYKGVYKMNNRPGFISKISHERKSQYLGYFRSDKKAAKAYDKAAFKLYGEFARLNFPKKHVVQQLS